MMNRQVMPRDVLRCMMVSAVLATIGMCASEQQAPPNFLFILADDVTYSTVGRYGGTHVKTPNIDRLAKEGMRFTRAYCAMSMCAPFRAELYTGLYPVRNGVAWNHSVAKPGTKSICHYFGEFGYRVGLCGKKHASPTSVFPFEDVKDLPAGPDVRAFLTRDTKQPFCLFVCSYNAHPPWRGSDVSQFDQDAMTLPPVIHDNPPSRTTFAGYLAEVAALDEEVGQILRLLEDTGQVDNTVVMFSSEQGWDFGFGKWTNWDTGIHSALIARWPGRIGPKTETDALVQMADVVPTFIEAAGGDPAAYQLDGVSFLSVLTGESETHREFVYGLHNNVPEGHPYPIRSIRDQDFHYVMNLKHEVSYHEKHLMDETLAKRYDLQWWKAMNDAAEQGDVSAKKLRDKFHDRPAEELYRVDKDPYEMDNLAGQSEYNEVKRRLRTELTRWMKAQGDPGIAMDSIAAYAANRKGVTKPPRVLIIGDSISIGYTPYVTGMLKNDAVIKHHRGNAEHTGTGLKMLDPWIGDTEWDVIHFNWGLWDLCYRHPESKVQGHRDKVNGTVTMSLVQYEENLEELVIRLKKTHAVLIWAHTTVVPEKEAGRFVGDDKAYNDVATRVMKKHNVTINDLNRLTRGFSTDLFTQPGNVHYTKQGYQRIARQVADKILTSLKGKEKDSGDRK